MANKRRQNGKSGPRSSLPKGNCWPSEKLAAAAVIAQQPVASQLRYLQTLTEIGVEKNTTIVFPLPLDIVSALTGALKKIGGDAPK